MTNQQLKAHCEDVIANQFGHWEDWVVDMARVALASLEAEPVVWIKPNSLGVPRMAEIDAVTIPYVPEYSVELFAAPPVPELKLPDLGSNEVNDAAWKLHDALTELGPLNGHQFNNLKGCMYEAFKVLLGVKS